MRKRVLNELNDIDSKNFIKKEDLSKREIRFTRIEFGSKIDDKMKKEGMSVTFKTPFKIDIKWSLLAIKDDKKGVFISCLFNMDTYHINASLNIETRMEFKKSIQEDQLLKTCFFQTFAAEIFFPYLVEIIAYNSSKIDFDISPLALNSNLLKAIVGATNKIGPFKLRK